MKKKLLLALFGLIAAQASHAAVTLQFGSSTDGFLTNLQNSSGQANQTLVWGIIVDTTGNGFNPGGYLPGATIADNAQAGFTNGQILGGSTDDVLVISQLLMATGGSGDGSTGLAKPTNLTGLNFANGISQGDRFALVWFDATVKNDGSVFVNGSKYGFYTRDEFVIPADSGSAVSFAALFAGADPVRLAEYTFGVIPEPSTALLGAVGALGLLRRRRN